MKEIEFDLLTEPWIRVRLKDNTVQEVSLTEALVSAQDYVDLAGEMPTQDAAVLRLLLAVLFTVFSRVNVKGEPEPLEKRGQALRRWSELWQLGHFPAEPIRDYLEQWKDRFWLFHPTHPFWQVPEARIGTEYGAAKLNGEMSESSNKLRLFPLYAGQSKEQLANEVGVVVTHISHIETGNSVPSLKTLIDIINALDCSADELLCIEIKKAKPVFDSWMTEQLADCSADEAKIIKETVVSLKKSLRKVYGKSSKYRYD